MRGGHHTPLVSFTKWLWCAEFLEVKLSPLLVTAMFDVQEEDAFLLLDALDLMFITSIAVDVKQRLENLRYILKLLTLLQTSAIPFMCSPVCLLARFTTVESWGSPWDVKTSSTA
jgi:hypothetical protein